MIKIRKARITDVPRIYELLKGFGEKGLMLPRSRSDLYDEIRAFHIACPEDNPDLVAGVCALRVWWEDLGEIRSLCVSSEYQGLDIGRRILDACMKDGKGLGLNKIFVLTYIPEYFQHYGFSRIDRNQLPHKIWVDCLKCIKYPDCGEVAMEMTI